MGRRAVARKYLRGWFALDFVASFPIDLLFLGRRLDIWRLPRLLKIIRVLHYKTLTQASEPLLPNPEHTAPSEFSSSSCRIGMTCIY